MHSIGTTLIFGAVFCFVGMLFAAGLLLDPSPNVVKFANALLVILPTTGILLCLIGVTLNALGY